MKRTFFLLSMILIWSNTSSQIIFKTEYFGKSSYRMTEGDSDKKVGNSKGAAIVYQGGINIPLSIKMNENNRPSMWSISVGGAYVNLNNSNFTEDLVIDGIMNLGLSINHLRPISNKWSLMASIGGGIYMPTTRFSQIRYKNMLGNLGAVFIYHLNPNLELGGGIAINNSFGYPIAFPALYLKWNTGDRYTVNVSMLDGIEISAGYNANNYLSLNIVAEMNGQMALLEKNGKDKIFSHQYIVAGFRPEIKLGKLVSIPVTAGIHAMRPAEITNRSLKSLFQDRGYYFQISFYTSAGLKISF